MPTTFQGRLAAYAKGLDYDALPVEVVAWARGVLLDSLGCAIAGSVSDPARISASVAEKLGGGDSTVVRTGRRVACTSAAFANGIAIRYEDLNDTHLEPRRVGHYSDSIASVLAVAEKAGSSGADVLTAIVVAYEALSASTFHGAVVGRGTQLFGAAAIPAVAGKLLGLDTAQIENAIGLSVSSNITLMTWIGAGHGEMPMIKASAFASTAHHGILAALLAAEGFTGPHEAVERYLQEFGHDPDAATPVAGTFAGPRFTMIKGYAAQMNTNPVIEAVLELAGEHAIDADDVAEVVVGGNADLVRFAAGEHAYHPTTREAADHSAPYVVVLALLEGDVLPAQYAREQWRDPRVISMIEKVRCVVDDECEERFRADGSLAVRVEIRLRSGASHAVALDNPRGHPRRPMTQADIEHKFRRVVAPHLAPEQQDRIVDAVAGLERAGSIEPLMRSLAFAS